MENRTDRKRFEATRLYTNLMDEAKQRLNIVEVALSTELSGFLPNPATSDLCALQFRKACECIAMGCLVAHGDIPEARAKSLASEYRADKLMRALEKMHPDFFPYPCTITDLGNGRTNVSRRLDRTYMQKAMLKKLYFMVDAEMHADKLSKRDGQFHGVEGNSLRGVLDLFRNLLDTHYIQLIDPEKRFVVTMGPPNQAPTLVISGQQTSFQ